MAAIFSEKENCMYSAGSTGIAENMVWRLKFFNPER
jgi:hypothetical protein